MMKQRLKYLIVLLSILLLFSSQVLLNEFDNVGATNADDKPVVNMQLCCCGNNITTCTDCCCSTPGTGHSDNGHLPIIASRDCIQDDGTLCQKVDYLLSPISFISHFPLTTSLKNSVVILENSLSNQPYKPPKA
ncbi:MAG: hypothetical protein GY941_25105 [Planctomycetes bacterium]|nr:hypothetical protein [Planctomycetota bacterium]